MNKNNFKAESLPTGIKIILLATVLLTGCATGGDGRQLTARLYQPTYLYLPQGKSLMTQEGIYTPQINESWVAKWKYQQLERDYLVVIAELKSLQSQKILK